ncbi:cytochrome P450 [Coleofasciculus sp. FACHB-1120]|uniref:cytochrome P450 n=1 Tax=Coleofasciculus sp. FACHB-1120 TaxID=2692783 RepID=UPI0016891C2B|nr:cytochrome P450 [Coleofasciculus sp. FACHB-1120]MBD2740031.1 cytochrome P450 [Coleofasciculus sp. FACHB-1120]
MELTNSLPKGPNTPRSLRLMKFIFQPIKYLDDYAKAYGDTFTIQGSQGTPIVYFSQPQDLQTIFNADSSQLDAGRGNSGLEFLMGDNSLLLLDGDRHQRQRQLLTPPFHGERMRAYGQIISEIAEQVMNQWTVGKPFNIRASMQEITLRVILRVVFGLDEGSRLEQLRSLVGSTLDLMSSRFNSSAFFFEFLKRDLGDWSPWGRMLRQLKQIDELIYAQIAERRAEANPNRQDILSLMMSARDEAGQPMTDIELRDELMTLLVAGHETTASALTWTLYWVDQLPQMRDKLLAELDSVDADSDPSIITKLPYLTAVCSETLRIYPIAPNTFVRVVRSPIEIGGYKLPPGALILPSIYLAHHREETYPQPKQFKPERFLERQFSQYEYLPFGGGNRRCIGMAFAMYEMKLVLATIVSRFQVSLVNKRPVIPVRRGLTLAAPEGMKMVATPRLKKPAYTPVSV